jgi:hypothetical protein
MDPTTPKKMKNSLDSFPPPSFSLAALAQDEEIYLGPAKVHKSEAGIVFVECENTYARAFSALGFPYDPCPGDQVLVIGKNTTRYIIGVLSGGGKTILQVPGDLEVRAPQGSISFHAGEEIRLQSATIRLIGRDIELLGEWIWQRCRELSQKVQGMFRSESGTAEQHVEGAFHTQASRISQNADGDIRLRGKTINLN